MKRCPECNDMALYDDTSMTCPICNATLVPYVRRTAATSHAPQTPVRPVSGRQTAGVDEGRRNPVFETVSGNEIKIRGLVSNVVLNSRTLTVRDKIADCFVRGVPFQFGNPVYETIIRVEEITDRGIPSQTRSIVFYGNAQGQIDIGDDVSINAVRRNDRIIARSVFVNDTESNVHTPLALNALLLLLVIVAVVLLALCLLFSIVEWFASGAFVEPLLGIIGAFLYFGLKVLIAIAPIVLLIWIFRKLTGI